MFFSGLKIAWHSGLPIISSNYHEADCLRERLVNQIHEETKQFFKIQNYLISTIGLLDIRKHLVFNPMSVK